MLKPFTSKVLLNYVRVRGRVRVRVRVCVCLCVCVFLFHHNNIVFYN